MNNFYDQAAVVYNRNQKINCKFCIKHYQGLPFWKELVAGSYCVEKGLAFDDLNKI